MEDENPRARGMMRGVEAVWRLVISAWRGALGVPGAEPTVTLSFFSPLYPRYSPTLFLSVLANVISVTTIVPLNFSWDHGSTVLATPVL